MAKDPRTGTGTRAKDEPSTDEAAPDAPESQQSSPQRAQADGPVGATGIESVKYTGGAGVRVITATQWKGAGVESQATTQWDSDNQYTLPGSDFQDDALAVLRKDPNMKITSSS